MCWNTCIFVHQGHDYVNKTLHFKNIFTKIGIYVMYKGTHILQYLDTCKKVLI